ncbi:hypothetical protein F2P81_004069 [Scophthalmus maximus]|uniref:Uncharacterized protein n=1 Tax=Scophthalmus maximus TaxID=52904 RepID=A0A6A4TL23_SCOMX|nr:hypothetical protein F2P81_004069 [Scophthalmus maximus]
MTRSFVSLKQSAGEGTVLRCRWIYPLCPGLLLRAAPLIQPVFWTEREKSQGLELQKKNKRKKKKGPGEKLDKWKVSGVTSARRSSSSSSPRPLRAVRRSRDVPHHDARTELHLTATVTHTHTPGVTTPRRFYTMSSPLSRKPTLRQALTLVLLLAAPVCPSPPQSHFNTEIKRRKIQPPKHSLTLKVQFFHWTLLIFQSVLGLCVGSVRRGLVVGGASGSRSTAAALQERVGSVGRLVGLLPQLRGRSLSEDTHLHHQVDNNNNNNNNNNNAFNL